MYSPGGRKLFARVVLMLVAASTVAATELEPRKDSRTASLNYRLHCEGCHKTDGSGQPGYIPGFSGEVSRFLCTPQGREYLLRVPGVAQSLLTNAETAEVLNWILTSFDPDGIPADFIPYTKQEVAYARLRPYSGVSAERARALAQTIKAVELTDSAGKHRPGECP